MRKLDFHVCRWRAFVRRTDCLGVETVPGRLHMTHIHAGGVPDIWNRRRF